MQLLHISCNHSLKLLVNYRDQIVNFHERTKLDICQSYIYNLKFLFSSYSNSSRPFLFSFTQTQPSALWIIRLYAHSIFLCGLLSLSRPVHCVLSTWIGMVTSLSLHLFRLTSVHVLQARLAIFSTFSSNRTLGQ